METDLHAAPSMPGPAPRTGGRVRSRLSRYAVVAGATLAVGSVGTYVSGLAFFHHASGVERDAWIRAVMLSSYLGLIVGVLVAWFGWVWTPIAENVFFRKAGSILALIVLVPVTLFFGLVFFAVWTGDCADDPGFCFDGPAAATFFGFPAFVAAPLSVLLAIGLWRRESRVGRVCSTLALTFVTGLMVTVVAGLLLSVSWAG